MIKSCIEKLPFHPCAVPSFLSPNGVCYELNEEVGKGYYWYYEKENMFALSVMELHANKDYTTEYRQPNFISLNYYDTVNAEEFYPYKKITADCIRGHVSKGELYKVCIHNDTPLKGIELMLLPSFYNDYINNKYPGVFPDAESAFKSIDGCIDFPKLVLSMKQVSQFSGSGIAADLYFESKIIEVISLIIERTKNESTKKVLSDQDMKNLNAVKIYIEENLQSEIKASSLVSVACMGQTKLRSSFKNAFGCTITQYIQSRRIFAAQHLLSNTNLIISEVAKSVGYNHAGRFSALFKDATGLSPEEYRKSIK